MPSQLVGVRVDISGYLLELQETYLCGHTGEALVVKHNFWCLHKATHGTTESQSQLVT